MFKSDGGSRCRAGEKGFWWCSKTSYERQLPERYVYYV